MQPKLAARVRLLAAGGTNENDLNDAQSIQLAAIIQIRHSGGQAYYDKKVAPGKTPKEALRALKHRISDAVFACLRADPAAVGGEAPEGTRGATLTPARPAHTRISGSSAKPVPGLTCPRAPSRPSGAASPARQTKRRSA